tara:strand:- start:6868 stop:7590 length:723 start_codon:yes stop_codon:yes gene_type:complete
MNNYSEIPKIILFDCFETLINNETEKWILVFERMVKDEKWNITGKKLWEIWKVEENKFRETRTNLSNINKNPPFITYKEAWENCFDIVFEKLNFKYSSEKAAEKCVKLMGNNVPYKDTSEILNELSKYTEIGIISNADNAFLNPAVNQIDFDFKYLLSSESAKSYKPDPTIFNQMLSTIGFKSKDCWYVGDKEYDDVIGSSNIGMKPILITRKVYNEKYINNGYLVVSNLTQILELFKKL